MFKNYLKIAWRNLWKNKASSFINMLGLTIGLSSCLLIGLYIQHELSYDNFELKGSRIARVIMFYKFSGGDEAKGGNYTSARVAPVFKQTFPEIESAVRMVSKNKVVQYQDKMIDEKSFMYADPSFFQIFSFHLTGGNATTALNASNRVVVTESTAKRYFGNENPVGKTLKVGTDGQLYQVTGVIPDCPSNSQIKFDFLASFSSLGLAEWEKTYWNANFTTYLLLKNKASFASLPSQINGFMQKEMAGQGADIKFLLEPFNSIHLHSPYEGFEANNNIKYIYILEAVAMLILLIACFTYINLNTSRSVERAKEVGVRKVIGAEKNQLFWQFIGESAMVCLLAVTVSLAVTLLLLPVFNQLADKQLNAGSVFTWPFLLGLLMVATVVSLLAGSYPALILSGFQPVKVLKGSFKNTGSGRWVRQSLIVFQFFISALLIISTFIMQKQLSYVQNKDLGYSRERIIILPLDGKIMAKLPAVKQEFKANGHVLNVSACYDAPVSIRGGYNMRSATMPATQQIAVTANPIDEDYIKTTGLHLVAGQDLSPQDMKDVADTGAKTHTYHFILNESAARQLGWTPQQAVGQKMFLDDSRPGYVKAVVKDFNFESLHNTIKPLVLFPEMEGQVMLLKLQGADMPQTISFLEAKWKTLVPYRPFEYRFMDEDFNKLYSSELRLGKLMNIFSGIAIALACLGLLGLSAYAARQRVKEVGIRKVLGAGVAGIAAQLSVDFVKLVVTAILFALPLAWWMMNRWLQDFAYRALIQWWVFALAGLSIVLIALLTVGYQAVKAALANPINSLRSE